MLTLDYGDPLAALGLYDSLQALSPESAADLADQTATGLARAIRARLRERRAGGKSKQQERGSEHVVECST